MCVKPNCSVFDIKSLRRTLGSFLTGVVIVTATDTLGRPRGITVNSFASVSLGPPLVLFCIDKSAESFDVFLESKAYAVNMLGADQRELAIKFASKDHDKFSKTNVTSRVSGAPILPDSIAWIDCVKHQFIDAGDHAIVIGRVVDFNSCDDEPIGFYQGRFLTLEPGLAIGERQAADEKALRVGWLVEDDAGRIALQDSGNRNLCIPFDTISSESLDNKALSALASRVIGDNVKIQFLYSMYTKESPAELVLIYRGVVRENRLKSEDCGIRFVSMEDFKWNRLVDESHRAIVRRYVRERVGDGFGIYAGTEHGGAVARLPGARMVETSAGTDL